MTAMDAATKNADEMLGRLLLHYNRARQAVDNERGFGDSSRRRRA